MLFYTACVAPPSVTLWLSLTVEYFYFFWLVCLHALAHSGRKSRCQSHFQVALHAQHCRDQNEDFCDLQEHIPVLQHQAEKIQLTKYNCTVNCPYFYDNVHLV